jgi:hypothetical protein
MGNRSSVPGQNSDQANRSNSPKNLLYTFIFGSGVIIILCLSLIIVFGVYYFREEIPIVSKFFPTRAPAAGYYSNSQAGLSLKYPPAWLVYEWHEEGQIGVSFTLAPTQEIIDAGFNSVETGVRVGIKVAALEQLGEADIRDIADLSKKLSAIGGITGAIEPVREFTIGGMPATSLVTTIVDTFSSRVTLASYLVLILRNDTDLVQINCVCPKSEWTKYQPVCNSIINSIKFH